MVEFHNITLKTNGYTDIIDITDKVENIIKNSSLKNGIVNIFCPGSTGGITTIEYEPNLVKDIKEELENLFPYHKDYYHHLTWNDDNGSSHIRSALIKTSFTVPFKEKRLILGTWQQIIFLDFDTRGRNRELVITIIGE